MLKKLHLLFIAVTLISVQAFAEIELNPEHPDTYVVQKGDTLWDISAMFLKSPWLWPEIWHANPQVENPHLIYPGDVLSLVYLDGKPAIQLTRNHPTLKLSPKTREISHENAIKTIPLSEIESFLKNLRILSKEEVDLAPYVVSMEDEHLRGTKPNHLYVRNLNNVKQGDVFAVVRPTLIYRDVPTDYPWESSPYNERKTETVEWSKGSEYTGKAIMTRFWKKYMDRTYWENVDILGYEVEEIGTAMVARVGTGDITTMKVSKNILEIKEGDLVLPLDNGSFDAFFQPKAGAATDSNIRVIALNNAAYSAAKRQIVAISRGSADGINVGDVYDVNRPEKEIRDNVMFPEDDVRTLFKPSKSKVTLPEENVANIMIFRTYDHISYGMIMGGTRPVHMYDYVRVP
ncbi:MAG: LysM peptidoglycan-binding domain-containing protein [Gammaproteobacteria bacterium]|nr:LysM peptidoglycan-binding domain-containing protein [Xanthomonadales bacterium]